MTPARSPRPTPMALEAPGLAKLIPHGPSLPCRVSSWATSAAAPASGTGTLVLNSFDLPARKRRRLAFAAWGPRVTTRAALAKRGPSTGLKSPTKAAAALPAEGAAGAARDPSRRGVGRWPRPAASAEGLAATPTPRRGFGRWPRPAAPVEEPAAGLDLALAAAPALDPPTGRGRGR